MQYLEFVFIYMGNPNSSCSEKHTLKKFKAENTWLMGRRNMHIMLFYLQRVWPRTQSMRHW